MFGGRYVPETLIPALDAVESAFDLAMTDPAFLAELDDEYGDVAFERPVQAP